MPENMESYLQPRRTVFSFWPFLLWILPLIVVYTLRECGLEHLCGRRINEHIALPLVSMSVVGYGLLACRRHNEFALIMFVLSLAFFCREWHFAERYLGLLPMEEQYHIPLEETMETMAHLMLAATCLVAWLQFGARKGNSST